MILKTKNYPQKQGISMWKKTYKLERANCVSQLTLEMTHLQVQPRKRIIPIIKKYTISVTIYFFLVNMHSGQNMEESRAGLYGGIQHGKKYIFRYINQFASVF